MDPTQPLADRHCRKGRLPRLADAAVEAGLRELGGWSLVEGGTRLHRAFRFADFKGAMPFVDAMAALAEQEGHHPDFAVHWNTVEVTLWTHDAGGLTENDLVLAARIGALPEAGR
jgi:4a-hydroxytetrahydrobiopterin dehydratase